MSCLNCKSTEIKKVLPHYINPLIIMFVKIVVSLQSPLINITIKKIHFGKIIKLILMVIKEIY